MAKRTFLILLALLLLHPVTHAQEFSHHVKIGVVLPLKEKSPRGAKMIEFYQGLLMAVDSVKRMGCSVDITALHSGSSAASMDSLLINHTLANCDVVFGPLDVLQLPALADYCHLHDIRLVVPFSSLTTQVTAHPLHYLANAPRHAVQKQAAWFAQALFSDQNVVAVESGEKNDEGTALVERVRMAIDSHNVFVRQVSIDADEPIFCEALDTKRPNVLILNSPTLAAFTALSNKLRPLMAAHPEYRISLFGYPAWQSYANQLQSDFYQFDTYFYTSFFRDPNDRRVLALEERYHQAIGHSMAATYPRYGLFGFDLGYYFIYGLGRYGDQFEANMSMLTTEAFQTPLSFKQQSAADGYINDFVEVIHYTTYHTIEILYRNQE